jgi:hypothetical protein
MQICIDGSRRENNECVYEDDVLIVMHLNK